MMQNRKFERFTYKKSPTLPTKYPAWNAGLCQSRGFFHTFSILSIIFSLLPIDVRQYGTRAAISTWHSWSTYRNRAIFRSYLPSGARFITAFICSASSPCNAGGKTMRAAATGSTEPEGLRQLSGVAHHTQKRLEANSICIFGCRRCKCACRFLPAAGRAYPRCACCSMGQSRSRWYHRFVCHLCRLHLPGRSLL